MLIFKRTLASGPFGKLVQKGSCWGSVEVCLMRAEFWSSQKHKLLNLSCHLVPNIWRSFIKLILTETCTLDSVLCLVYFLSLTWKNRLFEVCIICFPQSAMLHALLTLKSHYTLYIILLTYSVKSYLKNTTILLYLYEQVN